MNYIEGTKDDTLKLAEACGREYAKKLGLPYPMPPIYVSQGRQPDPSLMVQRYVTAPIVDDVALYGVLPVNADVSSLDGARATLGDGSKLTIDAKAAKDETLLSAAGKAVLSKLATSIGVVAVGTKGV